MARTPAVLAIVAVLVAATPAWAHQGNPNYLSQVDSAPEGLSVEVLNRDDRLLLRNESGEDLVIEGYQEEPYARIDADGDVFVNRNSEAYYTNDDRFGDVPVPDDLDPTAPPDWERLDGTGRFEWHDHRMHWMSPEPPDDVEGVEQRTKVFDWIVPTSQGAITGTLFWTPSPGAPVAFIVIGSAVVLVLCAAALVVRRRRDREGTAEEW